MKLKKISLFLILSICLALAAGCAQQPPAPDAGGDAAPAPQNEPAPAPQNEPAQSEPAPAPEPPAPEPQPMTYHIERTELGEGLPVEMYFEIPVFEGDSAAARAINAELGAVQEACINDAADVLEIVEEAKDGEYGPTEENPYIDTTIALVETCTEELVSVTIAYEWYMGGVLDYGLNAYNYNARTGERVYLTDLLDGSEEEIKESIVTAFLEQHPEAADAGVMETPMDAIRAKDIRDFNFYVQDGIAYVAFSKYEITYGAAGAFDVALTDDLRPLG